MSIGALPLCGGGRCSQLLAGIAEARERAVERNGEQFVAVLRLAAAELGIDITDQRANAAVAKAITEVTGATLPDGKRDGN